MLVTMHDTWHTQPLTVLSSYYCSVLGKLNIPKCTFFLGGVIQNSNGISIVNLVVNANAIN